MRRGEPEGYTHAPVLRAQAGARMLSMLTTHLRYIGRLTENQIAVFDLDISA